MINVCNRPKSELGRLFSLHTLSFRLITDLLTSAPPMDPASAVAPVLSAVAPLLYTPSSLPAGSVSRSASGFRSVLSSPAHHSVPHSAFRFHHRLQNVCVLWMFWNSASVYRHWSSLRWSSFRLLPLLPQSFSPVSACGRRTMCHRFQTYKEFR